MEATCNKTVNDDDDDGEIYEDVANIKYYYVNNLFLYRYRKHKFLNTSILNA